MQVVAMSTEAKPTSNIDFDMEIQIQKTLQKIVHSFDDYFIDYCTDYFGKRPKTIDFTNFRVEQKLGVTGIRLVKVKITTNLGTVEGSLAVKIYENVKDAQNMVQKIDILLNRVFNFAVYGIATPQVIFHRDSVVIMEGLSYALNFTTQLLPHLTKYFLAGRALAGVHGFKTGHAQSERYYAFVTKTLEYLPISDTQKNELRDLFASHLKNLESLFETSGTMAFGDFHPGNILFNISTTHPKYPLLRIYLIDPEFLEEQVSADRLEDISNFFVTEMISSPLGISEETLLNIKPQLTQFLRGYESILLSKGLNIRSLYQQKNPLNFHLALSIVLATLNYTFMQDLHESEAHFMAEVNKRLNVARRLLTTTTPFIKF